MRVLNDIDRFHLDHGRRAAPARSWATAARTSSRRCSDKLVEHKQYIAEHGLDLPEIRDWKWNDGKGNYVD